jgi:hypothetical protein
MAAPSRREFLVSLGALSAAPSLVGAEAAPTLPQLTADVLIIGGGTAGTIAAIQAGRLGARTILVEAGSQLGGTTTTAGVDFPGLFHAWKKQVIAGIGWELVTKTIELNGDKLPDFSQQTAQRHSRHQVEAGIRETFRIVGEATITVNDYIAGRVYPDAIAYAFYPIDLHDEHGVPKLGATVVTFIHPGGHGFPSEAPAVMVKFFKEHAK